jgi:Mg-chelatase subunit ChlD
MTRTPEFLVEVFQNQYLPMGAREVSAVVSVTATDIASMADANAGAASAAEIIIVDCSGSMSAPIAKLYQARQATAAAIDVIRDGTAFAVVAGSHTARPIYPANGTLAIASTLTRSKAKDAVGRLNAVGGTAIGEWLRLARTIFLNRPDGLRHVILLTDGQDAHETADQLAEAITLCSGVFTCDCRGVGTDWEVAELRKISTALLGTVDIVPDPAGLTADFEALMVAAMAK